MVNDLVFKIGMTAGVIGAVCIVIFVFCFLVDLWQR
jgi:hypothetical protein